MNTLRRIKNHLYRNRGKYLVTMCFIGATVIVLMYDKKVAENMTWQELWDENVKYEQFIQDQGLTYLWMAK